MASSGGGADYLSTVQGLIFGPARAYALELQGWAGVCQKFLDDLYPKGAAAGLPTLAEVTQILTDAMLSGTIPPAPIFKSYNGHETLTTDVKQGTDDEGKITAGVQISVVSLGVAASHSQTTTSDNAQNHVLDYSMEMPLPDGDRAAAAANLWIRRRQAEADRASGAAAGVLPH